MIYGVLSTERRNTILNNIRRLRYIKGISAKVMALEIGISPSEYSKLENGKKGNWEKYSDKIAIVLEILPVELAFNDKSKDDNKDDKPKNLETQKNEKLSQLIYSDVLKIIEEKDKIKDELLQTYKLNADYWKGKYERAKIRLEKADRRIIELSNKPFQIIENIN